MRYGNWEARPEGSGYYQRSWLPVVTKAPAKAQRVRSWDLASSVPSDVNPNPDWTVGVLMSRTAEGRYTIEDVVRFRDRPDGVTKAILETAARDGTDVLVTIPQDPGAAGKAAALQVVRKLAEQGNTAKVRTTHTNKVTRYSPFSAMAESGMVDIVQGSWNNIYHSESEAFTGDGKTKDD